LQYATATILLATVLFRENSLWINFKSSRVTKKFKKNIINIVSLTFLTQVVAGLRISMDTLILASKQDLGKVAIFGFITYLVMMMQAPIRSVAAVTIPILSRYWKEKNIEEIGKIYKRSSINLLTYSTFIFCFILLNFSPTIQFLHLNEVYLVGKLVFILLGAMTILELGTGVNGQIISTSSFFRFELWTSILLTALIIPLSYILTVKYGIIGPAAANLVSFAIYNFVRFMFLYRKFNMQPFSSKTIEVLIIAAISFIITHYAFSNNTGVLFIILRAILFSLLFITPVFFRDISPDFKPVVDALRKRLGK
jgi:O-antigen/teichoic acid export membrane protein